MGILFPSGLLVCAPGLGSPRAPACLSCPNEVATFCKIWQFWTSRSEERRVGGECRPREEPDHVLDIKKKTGAKRCWKNNEPDSRDGAEPLAAIGSGGGI